ncbi:hypothetical protein HZH66_013636 [Vespula vulgaris]|uniref:H15 domain-containing protein n=1 Tax=Vespula vulgaris TaxID=7454 RepID=A0A834MSN3_VESVU|nr:hypothetical protein HZH66_013636 [Vespula vulgaris]
MSKLAPIYTCSLKDSFGVEIGNEKRIRMTYPKKGASLEEIMKYVVRHARISESRARCLIIEALKIGIAKGRIIKIPGNLYALAKPRPGPLARKIREPNFEDNSSETSND